MKHFKLLLHTWAVLSAAVVLFAGAGMSQADDSTTVIFDENYIGTYHLEFYIDDWEDSLVFNYENGEEYMPARFICGDIELDSIGVRYKGNSSYTMSMSSKKKPLKFKFDKYKDYTFYDEKILNFVNCVKDPSFMRERIGYAIAAKYMPVPRTSYANIYIEGELIGLYIQVEQVDKKFLSRHFMDNDFNLYKVGDAGAGLLYLGGDKAAYDSLYHLKTNEDQDDWSRFIHMLDVLNNAPDSTFVRDIKQHLNIDRCIQHIALSMVISHFDSYAGSGRNYYFYDDVPGRQFQLIPWDHDQCFGVFGNNWDVIRADIIDFPHLDQRPLLRRVLENDSLRQVYIGYIEEMVTGPCSEDSIAAVAQRIRPLIDSSVQADPNKFFSYDDFITNIESGVSLGPAGSIPGLASFARQRNQEILGQIEEYRSMPIRSAFQNKASPEMSVSSFISGGGDVTVRYKLAAKDESAILSIFTAQGQCLERVQVGGKPFGINEYVWKNHYIPGGVYFFRLSSKEKILTDRLTVIR